MLQNFTDIKDHNSCLVKLLLNKKTAQFIQIQEKVT